MDETDRTLLQQLEENGRISDEELAELAGIPSEDATQRRRTFEGEGVIRKYIALIDWDKAGNSEVAAIIDLKVSPERDYGYDKIAERIARFREVRAVRLLTGVYDLQIIVTGRNMHDIARFVAEKIAPMDRIRETATMIIMKSYKENGIPYTEREGPERLPYSF